MKPGWQNDSFVMETCLRSYVRKTWHWHYLFTACEKTPIFWSTYWLKSLPSLVILKVYQSLFFTCYFYSAKVCSISWELRSPDYGLVQIQRLTLLKSHHDLSESGLSRMSSRQVSRPETLTLSHQHIDYCPKCSYWSFVISPLLGDRRKMEIVLQLDLTGWPHSYA